jgi:hypothetical protein
MRFSLIRCSIDPARLAQSDAGYARAFAGEPFESIVVRDARSLAEGYGRALAQARGRFVIFSHDDAWPVSPHAIDRLAAHLEAVDIVGIAGTDAALSAAWVNAGQPHLHGHVLCPDAGGGVRGLFWGADSPLVRGIKLLDGCFIATRTDVARAIGFDAVRFDGFHVYDSDFCFRAFLSGRALGVAADVTVYHLSGGDFGAEWQRYNERFVEAFGDRLDNVPPARPQKAAAHFASIAEAVSRVDFSLLAAVAARVRR